MATWAGCWPGTAMTLPSIARGPHLDALRQDGLEIKSTWGSFSVRVDATNDPHEVGQVDLVLFTVKTYQNAVAIPALQPLVGENTGVLTLQNGVESGDELAQVLGSSHVLPGRRQHRSLDRSSGGRLPDRPQGERGFW